MGKLAIMPLNDYVAACDTIREKIPEIALVDKTIYREEIGSFTETLVTGTLIEGEQYSIKYTDTRLGNVDEGGIYSASLVDVPNVGSAVGMAVALNHPADEIETHTIYVYQSGDNIRLYADDISSAGDGSVSISISKITGKIISGEIPEKINEVYEAGQSKGTDEFWDLFQNYGKRKSYESAFYETAFEYIRPKYKVIPMSGPTYCAKTFYNNDNLKKLEKEFFDFSLMPLGTYSGTGFYWTFGSCGALEEIEDIGLENQKYWQSTFIWCSNLRKIARIRFRGDELFDQTFHYCSSLEEVNFEGVIGTNGLNFQWSKKLSKASWKSIINCLSSTTTGLSITGSLESVKKAFETSEGANDGDTSAEWLELETSRSNWKINLL